MAEEQSNYKTLNYRQEARAEALYVSKSILQSSTGGLFSGAKVPENREIQDLLTLAQYVIGDEDEAVPLRTTEGRQIGWSFPIPPDAMPGIMSAMGEHLPDCDQPDCPIHGPRREAQNADPEDARSSFDPTDDDKPNFQD
jgi:hypothetical protein